MFKNNNRIYGSNNSSYNYKKGKEDTSNAFSNRDKIPKNFNALKSEFPELDKKKTVQIADNELNFTMAIQKEKKVEDDGRHVLQPGQVSYTLDQGKIIVAYGTEPIHREISVNDSMDHAVHSMIQKWDAFKEEFIENYGEDEYIRLYKMPFQEENTDSEEEEEEEEYDEDDYEFETKYYG